MIVISGLTWARRHKREFPAVITIEDPRHGPHGLRFHHQPHPEHLILRFYDLDDPIPEPYHQPWMRLAEPDDVQQALEFSKKHDDLLIHCHAGVSRSTALALAILTDRLCDPQSALETVLRLRSIAVPNRHVTALADAVLGYNGDLLKVLDTWDQSIPSNATRRILGRIAHFYEFGVPISTALRQEAANLPRWPRQATER